MSGQKSKDKGQRTKVNWAAPASGTNTNGSNDTNAAQDMDAKRTYKPRPKA